MVSFEVLKSFFDATLNIQDRPSSWNRYTVRKSTNTRIISVLILTVIENNSPRNRLSFDYVTMLVIRSTVQLASISIFKLFFN